jgi:tetratricopeptide (TPR) repeat protein
VTRIDLALSVLLVAITWIAFGRCIGHPFLNYDDQIYVYDNPHVVTGLNPANVAYAFTTFDVGNWHPITWLSLQLDGQIWAGNALGYHLTNVLLHAATVVVLFFALRRLTGARERSFWVAALFAIHPLRVESVAWVAERKDVLSGLMWMLGLLAYARYIECPGWKRYLLVVLALAVGLMSKPMLVTFPCVLLLLDWWPLRRSSVGWLRLVTEKWLLFLVVAIGCVITLIAQAEGKAIGSLTDYPLLVRLENAVVAYADYLGKIFWPVDLAVLYPHRGASVEAWKVGLAGVVLSSITIWAWRRKQQQPYLMVGWLWYVGTLVPVIGIVQVGVQAMADRYTYIPQIGVLLMLVWGLADALSIHCPAVVGRVAGAAAIAVLMVVTLIQAGHWQNGMTLWEHTLAHSQNNAVAHYGYGVLLDRADRLDEAIEQFRAAVAIDPQDPWKVEPTIGELLVRRGRLDEALRHCENLIERQPNNELAHHALGLVHKNRGNLPEAISHYEAALRLGMDNAKIHNDMAVALAQSGQHARAVEHFREAWRLDPKHPGIPENLGLVLLQSDQAKEAVEWLNQAVQMRPGEALAHFRLAYALNAAGRSAEARAEYRVALSLDPNWPVGAARAALSMASDANPARRNGSMALLLARQACQATGDERPEFLDVRAVAEAEVGQYRQAAATARQAADLARKQKQLDLARAIESRISLYDAEKPFRAKR